MKTYHKTLLAGSMAAIASAGTANAAPVSLDFTRDVRVVSGTGLTGPNSNRDDNNGGGDASALIGIGGGVDNFQIYDFDFSSVVGQIVTGDATLTFALSTNSTGTFSGSTNDTIWVRALFDDNAGWVEGTQSIGASDSQTDNGSASFLNRVQYNDDPGTPSGTTTPWLDDSGNGVANLLAALTADLDTTPGVVNTARPGTTISFTIDQAVVQSWVDGGFAGIVVGVLDNGDGNSRFRTDNGNLSFDAVPEPGSLALLGLGGLLIGARRRRS